LSALKSLKTLFIWSYRFILLKHCTFAKNYIQSPVYRKNQFFSVFRFLFISFTKIDENQDTEKNPLRLYKIQQAVVKNSLIHLWQIMQWNLILDKPASFRQ